MDIQFITRQMLNSYLLGNYKRVIEVFEENFEDLNCEDAYILSLLIRSVLTLEERFSALIIEKLLSKNSIARIYHEWKALLDSLRAGVIYYELGNR